MSERSKPKRLIFSDAQDDEYSRRDVFLLGAGFSKAIGKAMPLMKDLTQAITTVLRDAGAGEEIRRVPFVKVDFEQALSYLSEGQPWLTESERLRNRALFYDLSDAIQRAIVLRQDEVIRQSPECPTWLLHLVLWMHRHRPHVITLNYDTLLESAFMELEIPGRADFRSWDFRSFTIPPEFNSIGAPEDPGIKLLKLHGSVHWTYSGTEHFFGELVRDGSLRRWSAAAGDFRPFALEEGRVAFIVPPTFNKNRYFENEKVRHQWRRAWAAMANARRIFCIGYGMPPGDLLMQSLLHDADRLRDTEAQFYIVDRSDQVAKRYAEAGFVQFRPRTDYVTDSEHVTESFVNRLVQGQLDRSDSYTPDDVADLVRGSIQAHCARGSPETNRVDGTQFTILRIDEYGVLLPEHAKGGVASQSTRYVVWEVFVDLLREVQGPRAYVDRDSSSYDVIPFWGDELLFSLLCKAKLITPEVDGLRWLLSVDARVLSLPGI